MHDSDGGAMVDCPSGGCDPECRDDTDCQPGTVCEPSSRTCVIGSHCGAQEIAVTPVEHNLVVVLDRSCSMKGQSGAKTKWEVAVGALTTVTTAFEGKTRFGLELFPDTTGDHCGQDGLAIAVGPNREGEIRALLAASLDPAGANYPDGPCVTNIDSAMRAAADDPALSDPGHPGHALLITDGNQFGCDLAGGDVGTKQILTELRLRGVTTFVVGFGGKVDPAQLNLFAVAGGAARTDPVTRYYQAEDEAGLNAALQTIGAKTLGCAYSLAQTPPDPARLFVFFNNTQQVVRDSSHQSGWDYSASGNQVRFYGGACDQLRQSLVSDLDIVFGCPEATPN